MKDKISLFYPSLLLLIYLVTRCFAWSRTLIIDKHDSISYLSHAKLFLHLDFDAIINLNPDSLLFYPFSIAICSLPGWSVETGARLCSFLSSLILLMAFWGISKRLTDRTTMLVAFLLIALNPVLVFLSVKIITEPTYIALVYVGLWLYMTQYKSPLYVKSAFMGLIFGLSFICRTEGIIYLAVIPFFQCIHYLISGRKIYKFRKLAVWAIIYVVCFSAVAIPQVWNVSSKMGRLAINGRQAWIQIFNMADGKSNEEKLRGLDYSPKMINLRYIQSHPNALSGYKSANGYKHYRKLARKLKFNINDFLKNQLNIMIGPLGAVFFCIGLLWFINRKKHFELMLISSFILLNLVPPIMHDVEMRHIAIIIPVLLLVEGIGVVYLYRSTSSIKKIFAVRFLVILLFLFHLAAVSFYPLMKEYRHPNTYHPDYDPNDFKEPVKIARQIATNDYQHSFNVSARKMYFAYFAGGLQIPIPYTTYQGLVKYCELNKIDFVFLQHRLISGYPFLSDFINKRKQADFSLLYSSIDRWGGKIELYRFNRQLG